MKVLKRLFAALIVIILSTSLILWVLARSVSPEVIKNYVSSQLSALTQQKSIIEGDISWQIFPRPSIKITKIQIGESDSQFYSVKLENLFFNLKITPLIRGKLVFSELIVDGFKINIHPDTPAVLAKNLRFFKLADVQNTNLPEQFAIERFLLSHGQVNLIENHRKIILSGLQIGAEHFNLDKTLFPLQLKANVEGIEDHKKFLKAQLSFKGYTSLSIALFSNPIIALQNTPLEGQLSIQNVKMNQLSISKINAHTKTKPGVLLLNPLTINLYDGESVGDLHYEFASKKLLLNQTATNIDSAQFIYSLIHKPLFKGLMDFSLHIQANLQDTNWQDNSTGKGSLTIKNGMVESLNLDRVIADTSDKINQLFTGKTVKKEHQLERGQFDNPEFFKGGTRFKLLTFQYLLKEAKLHSNSLVLQTDKLQLKGDGILDLENYGLDSKLFAKVTISDIEVEKIQQLLGGSFPILISGTLAEPQVKPDVQKINPLLTHIWFQETLTKPVKAIGNTLETLIDTGQEWL